MPVAYQPPIEGNLEVRGLSFRYAEGEPLVLRDINLDVRTGDYVAITGPSGCGNITLLKLVLGLLDRLPARSWSMACRCALSGMMRSAKALASSCRMTSC